MNKIAHYLNFMGKARAYGLTKEAADDLYKEAGVTSTLVQAARKAAQGMVAQGNRAGARLLQRDVGLMLGQRAHASKYGVPARYIEQMPGPRPRADRWGIPADLYGAASAEQKAKMMRAYDARYDFFSNTIPSSDPMRITDVLVYPLTTEGPGPRLPSFKASYPAWRGRRYVFNELRMALGKPTRDLKDSLRSLPEPPDINAEVRADMASRLGLKPTTR